MWFCSTGNGFELKFQALATAADSAGLDLVCDSLQLFRCKGVKKEKEKKKSHTLGGKGTLLLCAHGLKINSLPQIGALTPQSGVCFINDIRLQEVG